MGHLYLTQKRNIYKLYVFDKQWIQAIMNHPVADKITEILDKCLTMLSDHHWDNN